MLVSPLHALSLPTPRPEAEASDLGLSRHLVVTKKRQSVVESFTLVESAFEVCDGSEHDIRAPGSTRVVGLLERVQGSVVIGEVSFVPGLGELTVEISGSRDLPAVVPEDRRGRDPSCIRSPWFALWEAGSSRLPLMRTKGRLTNARHLPPFRSRGNALMQRLEEADAVTHRPATSTILPLCEPSLLCEPSREAKRSS